MTDGWTDRRNRTLLNFLVSSGGSTMFLKSIDASSHVKNVAYLCEAIEEVIDEVGEENVVQVVTDNAASYVAAGKLLMERHPKIFWSPCAAHCLDLMLEDIEIVQVTEPLVVLLRVVDGEKPAMGYIYEGMDRAKEAIRSIYAGVEDNALPASAKKDVLKALSQIIDPDFGTDIVSCGFVKDIELDEISGEVSFRLELTTPACPIKDMFEQQANDVVAALPWVQKVSMTMSAQPAKPVFMKEMPTGLKAVSNIIAFSSCKGGVGKSTVAVNLAYTLAGMGARVGIFDTDVYGPSLPTMVSPENRQLQMVPETKSIIPTEYLRVKLVSFGFAGQGCAIMRGPMVSGIINQLLTTTEWGELDYLLIDMPPGTGSTHSQDMYSQDDLPVKVARSLDQGSKVTSLDFHSQQHTVLLVGTSTGDIGIWDVGLDEKLFQGTFKVWAVSNHTTDMQATFLVDEPTLSVNRCIWSPNGGCVGAAFSKCIIHTYSSTGARELMPHLEINAHIGGVNDIAFNYRNRQLFCHHMWG
ncbi:hypothetical protein SUGI_0777100 [Cryptomeria japonica]|nr:hypothetical protein SUGI_0777100 [Cryptomeria japonica]